jgi:hypothetical protein
VAGIINAPLMAEDYIATAPNSRAEVQFDNANLLRLGGMAQIHLTTLQSDRYQLELAQGTLTYRILRPSSASIEIDTPNVSVRPSKIGVYRISVTEAGETQVTVRAGDVEVFTPRGSQWVNAGQTMIARGPASDPEFRIAAAIASDDWDRWNETRDRSLLESPSAQHVPPGVYGAEDMDGYGRWVNVPDYGSVWQPTVVPGWAPYSCGRWIWEDWYGWTWVDCAAWGWAPFHYGRWFWGANYGWLWYPGVIGVRHYWAPGLVAFFGYGGGFGVGFGFGFGSLGWVPLAPYEMFHPWWGRGYYGAGVFNRGLIVANSNIYNSYRNARVANGVSSVGVADFQGGRFNSIGHASAEQIRAAGLIRGQVPVSPTRANLSYGGRTSGFTPRSAGNRSFFTHQSPASVDRVPFARQAGGSTAAPANRGAEGSAARSTVGSGGAASSGGWRRFGEPAGQSGAGSAGGYRNGAYGAGAQRSGEASGSGNRSGSPQSLRVAPPVVRERSGSSSGAPETHYGQPSYSAPQHNAAPSYSAPQQRYSAPSYSAPRSSGSSGSSGGGRVSGGGGHAGSGGHGGGHR